MAKNEDYIPLEAGQIKRHKRICTKWINVQLAKANPRIEVTDFVGELRDGVVLISLIEVLLGVQVTRAEPCSKRINQIRNVQEVMRLLLQYNVKPTGIIASEITAGDEKAILGLVWSIILRFQINEAIKPDPEDFSVDKKLIAWCQGQIKGNSKNRDVSDLTSSWADGLGLNLILHSFTPSLVEIEAICLMGVNKRLTHALDLASETYGVPSLFKAEDFNTDIPDKKVITLFLSYLYLYQVSRSGERTVVTTEKEEAIQPTLKVEYELKTITSHQQTSQSSSTTQHDQFQSITTYTRDQKSNDVFHDATSVKDAGEDRILHISGFPQSIHIQERRALVVSPFRIPTPLSSRSSSLSDTISPIFSKSKESDGDKAQGFPSEKETSLTMKEVNDNEDDDSKEFSEDKKEDKQNEGDKTRSLLISTEKNTELSDEPNEAESVTEEDIAKDEEDSGPVEYFQSHTTGSSHSSCPDCMNYLRQELDAVDQSLFELENSLKHSDKDLMDLNTTKSALDHHKEVLFQLESVESKLYDILEEGKGLITEKQFDKPQEDYFNDTMDATEAKLKRLEANINTEYDRLFDLYIILLNQHLERMNDWLLRAESRMALEDVIEPTHNGVRQQVADHQGFQEELSNYSMVNMILEMDLEDPAIDETIRDWVKVLSERWAAVWTWAEEWKEKLTQSLLDWNKFREEETYVLGLLSDKENTLSVIGETDITNDEQVKTHLKLLETLEIEMESQGTKLESLHYTGEQLIKDADYYNSKAKGIRDQIEDFNKCWADIFKFVKDRKEMLEDAQTWVKQMGLLMKEVRSWLDDTEMILKFLQEEKDPSNENKIHETIELKCEERDQNQTKVDEIKQLEDALCKTIDTTSTYYMKRVTKTLYKRWDDASSALCRYRNGDYPFFEQNGCFFIKYLKELKKSKNS